MLLLIGVGAGFSGVLAGDPTAPGRLAATPLSPTSVLLSWSGAENNDKYVIHFGPDRNLTPSARTVTTTTTKTTLSGLPVSSPGAERFFRVDAYRGDKIASSRTGTFDLLPTRIAKLKVGKKSTSGVELTWAQTANTRQYDVVIAHDKAFTKIVRAVRTVAGDRTFVARGL